jgi:predicted ATP-dependent protease
MVLLPAENHKDVEKLPRLESLTIIHLSSIEELLEVVFMKVNESKDKYLRDPSSISKSSANASADQNQLQEAKGAVMTGTIIPPRLLSAL